MQAFKNFLSFFLAATIFFTICAGVLFVIKDKQNGLSEFFCDKGGGEYVVLGKEMDFRGVGQYFTLCSDFSKLLLPDFSGGRVKNTAELLFSAVTGISSDLYLIASDLVYGNM